MSDKVDTIKPLSSKYVLKKMNSAYESRRTLAKDLFQHEINNIPQSVCVIDNEVIELFHGSNSGITKRFLSRTSTSSNDQEAKSAIVFEMSPIMKVKAHSTETYNLTNFGECHLPCTLML